MIALATLIALSTLVAEEKVVSSTLTVTLTPTVSEDAPIEKVVVTGNEVLSTQVYRALVNLPEDARLTRRTAARAQRTIERFLKLAGYELAVVKVAVIDNQLRIDVDEGRLERIVFLGSSGLGTLRLQLMLDLPGRVFNRADLESQLDQFRRERGLRITEYQLITVKSSTTTGNQMPEELGGLTLTREAGNYELHIVMNEPDYPPGFGLELRGEAADGIVSALRYRFAEVFVDNDRIEVAGVFGLRPQKVFGSSDGSRWISKAGGRVAWVSPEFKAAPLRLLIGGDGYWGSRARPDLGITRYDRVSSTGNAWLRLKLSRWIELEGGAGVLADMVTSVDGGGFESDDKPLLHPIIFLRGEMSFGMDDVRLDRRHEIEVRLLQVLGSDTRTHFNASYEKSIGFDYDDLVFNGAASLLLGERPYYALDRVSDHIRGGYSDQIHAWALGSAGLEYRLSLSRELLKVGFAYDAALYARDLGDEPSEIGLSMSAAVGLHALLLDSFRFSLYAVASWAIDDEREGGQVLGRLAPEPGLSLSLSQVF